jgi:hypothetical protein
MQSSSQPFERILEVFSAMPDLQALFVVLFFVFSIVAGNAVFALHYRRIGKPVLQSLLNPTSFPLLRFNAREWILLLIVFAISLGLGALAALSGRSVGA